jgi:hypothetical protein
MLAASTWPVAPHVGVASGSKAVLLNGGREVGHGRKETREVRTSKGAIDRRPNGANIVERIAKRQLAARPSHAIVGMGNCCWDGTVVFQTNGNSKSC